MLYEWDRAKAAANLRKHGIDFTEAASVFLDPLALTYPDPDHFVAHLDHDDECVRILSARPATRRESHDYRERR